MISRRGAFTRIFGGLAAAKSLSTKEAMEVLGLPPNAHVGQINDVRSMGIPAASSGRAGRIRAAIYHARNRAGGLNKFEPGPASITTKRSWSPAYKEMLINRERAVWRALEEKMESEGEGALDAIAKVLGIHDFD